jgi:membrane-associated protease RseP (regulator of RpoE activity)
MTAGSSECFTLVVLVVVLTIIHSIGSVLACMTLRVPVEKVIIFYGKPLATMKTPLCPIVIGCLPYGGSVAFDVNDFDKRSLFVRWMVVLSGPLAMLLFAAVLLKGSVAISEFGSGFFQIVSGTIEPLQRGTPLAGAFFGRASESLVVGAGLLAAKFAAFNLLPIPPLAGGRLLTELPGVGRKVSMSQWFTLLGAALSFVIMGCWLVALVNHWRQP